jgi:hypothetical protein
MPLKVNLAHHPLHPFGVIVDLGHVFAQDPPGHVLRWGWVVAAQQLQPLRGSLRLQHQGLVDVAHAHPLGDVVPEALVGLGVVRHAPNPGPDACCSQLLSSGSQANTQQLRVPRLISVR